MVASISVLLLLRSLCLYWYCVLEDDGCEERSEWEVWTYLYVAVLN